MNNRFQLRTKDIGFSYGMHEIAPVGTEISHCHDAYEFLFIVNGKGKYIIEGAEFLVTPGTLMCARPLEYHCIKIDASAPYERYVLHFTASSVLPEARELFETIIAKKQGEDAYSAFTLSESFVGIFDRFSLASSLDEERREPFMRLLLSELIMLLSVSAGETRSVDEGELGARVIKYLNENIDKNINLDKIAKRFFVSKYYLCRAFKKHNGISVHGYINRKRIMLAKQLIESGETASGAAYRVGFGDYSAFYRAYVKVLGEAPTVNVKTSESISEDKTNEIQIS
ncbi:MAG: helix-turn-helix transcriptional regulator [Clostridia bacterium]|nr:helix-turn-helix transcriptional regulator [Clostridia bacterium]